ncbi:hypothetical protein M422DRAFT_268988 [Sphaerobolus stellatus SS14]|uniref:DDE-1 domain-containing protein n=1 Tax=Sphaerobolus stellatus (strain SS14) TaxID=990650 RepID=A0A0C9UWU5_SPHS4|nr:hypothetical protein M422DRAFT_268988 [Sphaerobolus stellatus SS14]
MSKLKRFDSIQPTANRSSQGEQPQKMRKNVLGDVTSCVTNEAPLVKVCDREDILNEAMIAVRAGSFHSAEAAVTHSEIPSSTLKYRLNGGKLRREGHVNQQHLNTAQKETFTRRFMRFAECCLLKYGSDTSSRSIQKFLLYNTRPLDPKRARAFNPTTVDSYFKLLEETIAKYNIPLENIYNTDEKGLQLGGGRKSSSTQQIFETGTKDHYVLKGDSLVLITIIEADCADGTLCLPGLIMPPGATGDWVDIEGIGCFTQWANEWMDNFIRHNWFEKCFIPFTKKRNKSSKPILLISDGHQSHETEEMHLLAYNNEIILLSLPPHTTHKLQPLDVGVFGSFQRAWTKHCENSAIKRIPVTRYNVVERFMKV